MIQRLQSLYLGVVASLALLLFFVPIRIFKGSSEHFIQDIFGVLDKKGADTYVATSYFMVALPILICLLAIYTIFLYSGF